MATIRARKSADGSLRYTAQIHIKKNGMRVYQESQTFARRQAVQAWAKRREPELNEPGAIERANRFDTIVASLAVIFLALCVAAPQQLVEWCCRKEAILV